MKSLLKKISGLAVIFLLNNIVLAESSFIEDEESFYRSVVASQLVAPSADLMNPDNPDKKSIKFALTVYGEYFGSFGILSSIEYYIHLKKHKLEETEEFLMVQSRIKSWGRKSALTILSNKNQFSEENKKYSTELAGLIEGVERWDVLRNDSQYLKAANFWNDVSKLPQTDVTKQLRLSIDKVLITPESQGNLNLSLKSGITMEVVNGRAILKNGKLAKSGMSLFSDIEAKEIEKADFGNTLLFEYSYGESVMAWRTDSASGIVQTIRGKKQDKSLELYVLKSIGFERSSMCAAVNSLSNDDLTVLSMRGTFVVNNYARQIDYDNIESLARFGSRMSATRLQSTIAEKSNSIEKYEPVLIIYANSLPSAPDKDEYKAYTEIIFKYKN